MERRVVVTGMGIISPLGNDLEEFKNNLFSGKSGIDRIKAFDPNGLNVQIAAEVKDFDLKNFDKEIKVIELKRIKCSQLSGPCIMMSRGM